MNSKSDSELSPLQEADRLFLLGLARGAVTARLERRPVPEIAPVSWRLQQPQGAFVTLLREGALRGCIGILEAARPLVETVAHCAAAAATEDPRFDAVSLAELPELLIEITLLRPPFAVQDFSQVVLGRHGLVATRGHLRGVLLPQVAIQHGFDVPAFIREVLKKAGLPQDALQGGGASLLAFEGEVFAESPRLITGPGPGSPPRSREPTG